MESNFKLALKTWVKNSIGWTTNRKIVVFESDDWGSIRMPSLKAYDSLVSKGIKLDSAGGYLFNRYDTLENEDDLSALFQVLESVKDKNGKSAVFTMVGVVANPDFDKIRDSDFEKYYYEPFTSTLEKYQGHGRTFELWKQGVSNNLIVPQSHSREHLNTLLWMKNLRNGNEQTRIAFDHGMWGYCREYGEPSYQIAFNTESTEDIKEQQQVIIEGLDLFEVIYGFRSTFFVPPNGLLSRSLEETLSKMSIKYLYGSFVFELPTLQYQTRKTLRYLGQKNKFGQKYILRNCLFEPNEPTTDWLSATLKDIDTAFKYKKPAILGPHRKNFIGSLSESNRKNSLDVLGSLLKEIVRRWPDVEFMSTDKLGQIMAQ